MSCGSNPYEFDLTIRVSDCPSLFLDNITCPCLSRFLYPGNGVNTGLNPCLSLTA